MNIATVIFDSALLAASQSASSASADPRHLVRGHWVDYRS
jgi:hypothetical protein